MAEVMFVVSGDGEQFLIMAIDGSVTRWRAGNGYVEQMDTTGTFVIGTEEGRFDAQEEGSPGVPTRDHDPEAPADCY